MVLVPLIKTTIVTPDFLAIDKIMDVQDFLEEYVANKPAPHDKPDVCVELPTK
jgi:hypothetical protein